MLDRRKFSSIIYILYEGGLLRPPVVTTRERWVRLSSHRSRRTDGEEDCEEGRQEEGREEAVGLSGGVRTHPPPVPIAHLPRGGSWPRSEGVRQQPVDVPGGRSRALARTARSHTLHARKGGIGMAKKAAKGAKKKATKKR